MSIFAFFHSTHDLHKLKSLFPAAEQCGQKYALYHVAKQQNIFPDARMALYRPGAFCLYGAVTSGQHGPNFIPVPFPATPFRFTQKSEWRKGRWKLPSIITDKL